MITKTKTTDAPCELCRAKQALEVHDDNGDKMTLCVRCILSETGKQLDAIDRVCMKCDTRKGTIIRCKQKSTQDLVYLCLPCANKINDESSKWK